MSRKPIQLDLFSQPTLNVGKVFKLALCDDVRASGLSRDQVVDRMNDLAERHGVCLTHGNSRRLTVETFEKWLNAEALDRMMPLKALPVFCAATGQCAAFSSIAEPMGLRVIGDQEKKLLAWAESKMQIKKHSRKLRKLEAEL